MRKYDDGQWHRGDKVVEDASDVSVEHGRGRVVHGRHGGGRGSPTAVDEDEFGSEDDAELGYLWLQGADHLMGGNTWHEIDGRVRGAWRTHENQ